MTIVQSFVVSLPQNNQKRRAHIIREFDKHKVPFTFFDAVTPEQNSDLLKKYQLDTKSSELTPGAMACLLSHYTLWQKVITEDLPYIAIFEDDIYLGENASQFLTDQKWLEHNDFHVMKIEKGIQTTIKTTFRPKEIISERALYPLKSRHYGMGGYIISLKGALYLTQCYRECNHLSTVDKFIFEKLLHQPDYQILQMLPALCIQDCILHGNHNNFPTTLPQPEYTPPVSPKKTLPQKILREIKRPFLQLKNKIFKLLFIQKVNFK